MAATGIKTEIHITDGTRTVSIASPADYFDHGDIWKSPHAFRILTNEQRSVVELLYGFAGDSNPSGREFSADEVRRIFKTTQKRVESIREKAIKRLTHPVLRKHYRIEYLPEKLRADIESTLAIWR